MPAFSYSALDTKGLTVRDTLEAEHARSARAQLRKQGLIPLSVEPVDGTVPSGGFHTWRRGALGAAGLAVWTRQLAGLVGAGLPLERALASFAHESEGERVRRLMQVLRTDVQGGASFSAALEAHPHDFPAIYVGVVAAGEQSGQLDRVLTHLADELEEREALKDRLFSAALYPAVVSLVALAIVAFLLAYVVPQVASVFVGSHRTLPALTVFMLTLSEGVRHWGLAVVSGLAAAAAGVWWLLRDEQRRLRFDAAWLRLPVVGLLSRSYNAVRFTSTLAMLCASGIPILKALQSAAMTLGNEAMRHDAMVALGQVREGASLATALGQGKRFPAIVPMFARLGEQTGELPGMLHRAARQLSIDVHRRASRLATLLEPLLIVAMGVIVLLIVLAVLLPIIQMNQWTGR